MSYHLHGSEYGGIAGSFVVAGSHDGGVPLLQMSSSDRCLPCQLHSAKSSAGGVRSSDRREGIHESNRLGGVYEECAGGERFHGGGRREADGGASVGHPFFQQFALQELEAPGFHALIAAKPATGAAQSGSGPTDLLEVPLKPQPQWTHFSSLSNGQCFLSDDSSQNASQVVLMMDSNLNFRALYIFNDSFHFNIDATLNSTF